MKEQEERHGGASNQPRSVAARAHAWLFAHSSLYREYATRWRWKRAEKKFGSEHDPELNRRSTPPPGECVSWHAVWLAEVFTLSQIDELADQLAVLSKRGRGFASGPLEKASESLRSLSAHVGGGAWFNLGTFAPSGRFLSAVEAEPPAGVERVDMSLHALLPSAVVLVASFVFDEDQRNQPDALLRREWTSRTEPRSGWLNPHFRKAREIRDLRFQTKQRCARWLRESTGLHGLFASGVLEGGRYPAIEWWTTRAERPFTRCRAEYMALSGLSRPIGIWVAEEWAGARLTFAESDEHHASDSAPSYALVLAGREDEFLAGADLQYYGGHTAFGWWNKIANDTAGLTALWGLEATLRCFELQVAELRRGLLRLNPRKVRRAVQRLQTVEERYIRASGDLLPILNDIAGSARLLEEEAKQYSGVSFFPERALSTNQVADEGNSEKQMDLPDWARTRAEWIEARAERLQRREASMNRLYEGMSASLGARSNLRLQRQIMWLTLLLVALTVVVVVLTVVLVYRDDHTAEPNRVVAIGLAVA